MKQEDPMTPSILLLTPERQADFMRFFDSEATFTDNPRWSSCYCQCFYEDHRQVRWADRTAEQNRHCASQRIASGQMQGLLAYQGAEVVGWCNAAPRAMLHALDGEPLEDAARVGTILCFLVAPNARGQGIASALLDAACTALKAQGLEYVEANPRPAATGTAQNHYGPLGMYLKAGFGEYGRDESDGGVWLRKKL